jgi:hypothetical protein
VKSAVSQQKFHRIVKFQGRDYPLTHPPAEAPLCGQCQQTEAAYFDLSCLKCLQLLLQPQTTISQIFAVMRQWNPHTQRSIKFCIQQVGVLFTAQKSHCSTQILWLEDQRLGKLASQGHCLGSNN